MYSRIDRISNPSYPKHKEFIEACKSILGITISASASTNGKRAGYIVNEMDDIPLPSMGDGVAHIASFIADLCHGDGHIFLIEELENDIHPNALKSLLRLIVQKSNTNQFCISTHSNIVLKELGGDPDTKVFYVEKSEEKIPTSKINIIETQKDRRDALEELGYDISDFYLWKAWLMFEESSAERLVRELLIPRFFPKLKDRLRTYSAKGKDNVKNRFNEINNIFVFLHLTEIYKNKVWILIDSGEEEKVIINDLISKYEPKGWNRNNFNNLSRHTIEEFYPNQFSDRVCDINSEKNKAKKDEKKEKLLDDVIIWGNQNPSEVEVIFSEIINLLGTISNELDGKGS